MGPHLDGVSEAGRGGNAQSAALDPLWWDSGIPDDEVEAAKARDRKAYELHGEFAYLNFPEDYGMSAGRTQRRRRSLTDVIARSVATKQSRLPAREIASLRSQ